ncbi:hypothetical protein HN385_06080 [archaeon]|jgi:hypothetical protein|nr:hypothetical protein [archaeon]
MMNIEINIHIKDNNIYHEVIRDGVCFNYFNFALMFIGFISDFRISKTAQWTENFTIPTENYDRKSCKCIACKNNS